MGVRVDEGEGGLNVDDFGTDEALWNGLVVVREKRTGRTKMSSRAGLLRGVPEKVSLIAPYEKNQRELPNRIKRGKNRRTVSPS